MVVFEYIFIFLLFSVVGWLLELFYRTLTTKRFVNPGFMSGCVVPLYGFGACILNIICNLFIKIDFNYNVIIIFILSVILLSILELISGILLEKIFHLRLWDYSDRKYNYKGFICLEFSIIWGFLALIYYNFIYSWINSFSINFVNNTYGLFFLGIFVGIFLIDLCVSIGLSNKLNLYAQSIKEIINLETLKIDVRNKNRKKKFINAIYPYISTNRFLREKIKELKSKDN